LALSFGEKHDVFWQVLIRYN